MQYNIPNITYNHMGHLGVRHKPILTSKEWAPPRQREAAEFLDPGALTIISQTSRHPSSLRSFGSDCFPGASPVLGGTSPRENDILPESSPQNARALGAERADVPARRVRASPLSPTLLLYCSYEQFIRLARDWAGSNYAIYLNIYWVIACFKVIC